MNDTSSMTRSYASRFTDVRGRRIHHVDHGGDGRPIVLVHGVLGHAHMWDHVVAELRGHGRVLALDLAGYGDSQWLASQEYTTESHAADVAAWMDAHDLQDALLAGFSWGGLVGIELAATRPELVGALALIEVAPSSGKSETDLPPVPLEFDDHAAAVAAERRVNAFAPDVVLEDMAAFSVRPGPGGVLVKKHDALFAERWPFRADDRWQQLEGLSLPTLIVRAGVNGRLSADDAERMSQASGNAQVIVVPESGHLIPLDDPLTLGAELAGFAAAVRPQGA